MVQASESIAQAIQRARAGTTIVVEPGEYRETLTLKSQVRLVSSVPRAAILRLPGAASERAAAIVAIGVTDATLEGFRIVGDAATPLGTGVLTDDSELSISNVEISGAARVALDVGKGSRVRIVAGDIRDNPGSALAVRAGATALVSHSVFTRNGATAGAQIDGASSRTRAWRSSRPTSSWAAARTSWPDRARRAPRSAAATGSSTSDLLQGHARRRAARALPTMTTVFNRVGRYEIHEQIGRGGMAVVFLATDTETSQRVALKLVSIEADRDGQQVLEAERWGATLQEEFCRESRYVPAVYAHGTHGQYFFIAMEYLEGRNLSEVIGEGPMPAARAVHIASQICEFLQATETFERTLDGRTFNLLLHGDLKPRNIRVLADDEIKVFDFGIAKALSLSRKVTRNDFGSIAYLSPERLESGEIDAQAELWAVGVLLYEMVSGVQPFRAADTRRLEQRIRARQPPAALDGACPAGLQAIVAKLLAPAVADRYGNATAIRDDLHRFAAGEPVLAEREGWPDRGHDEAATRRTHRATADAGQSDAEVTRRTVRDSRDSTAAPPGDARAAARHRGGGDDCSCGQPRTALPPPAVAGAQSPDDHRHRHGAERDSRLPHRRSPGAERALRRSVA